MEIDPITLCFGSFPAVGRRSREGVENRQTRRKPGEMGWRGGWGGQEIEMVGQTKSRNAEKGMRGRGERGR